MTVGLAVLCGVASLLLFQNCSPGLSSTNNEKVLSAGISATTAETELNSTNPTQRTSPVADRCESGWVLVPGNPDLGTYDFCIMKFEAQNSAQSSFSIRARTSSEPAEPGYYVSAGFANGLPQSKFSTAAAAAYPWVYVTQEEAIVACQKIGAHLTTMAEAQTVSRNLLLHSLNWDSTKVGQGCMYGGHLDLDPATTIPVGFSEATSEDHYYGTNDQPTSYAEKDMGRCFTRSRQIDGVMTTHKNGRLSRRTLALSTNQLIWDWSGNSSEWIANTCNNNGLGKGALSTYAGKSNGYGFFDYDPASHPTSTEAGRIAPIYTEWTKSYLFDFESWIFGPRNPRVPGTELLDSKWGVGMYQGCRINGNAIYRGGAAYHGYEGGIFQTHMDHTTKFNHPFIGFRCVKAPLNGG